MGINSTTRKALRGFAQVVVQKPKEEHGLPRGPWFGIPRDLLEQAVALDFNPETVLRFSERELTVIYEARRALVGDPALEHLSPKEVVELLRTFAWRLTLAHAESKSGRAQKTVTNDFLTELEAPISLYIVLYEIEYLQTPVEGFELGMVSIRTASQEDLDEWGLSRFRTPTPPEIGSTIAICQVEAGSPRVADQRTGVLVDQALDAIRVSVAQFGFRIWDNQMRFDRKPWFFAKREGDDGATSASRSYNQVSYTLELKGDALAEFSHKSLDLLSMAWDKRTPQGLRDDLIRSIRWLGKSIKTFSMDDKVTALCTALECLLSDRSAALKSVDICRRSMVLAELSGEGFIHPSKVTHLYEARSQVVHGSALGVCDESDYRILLRMAIDVLEQVIQAVRNDPKITTKQKLFSLLDDPERLKPCLKWCKEADPQGLKPLIDDMSQRVEGDLP